MSPSSGREHTIVEQSSDDYSMNETRRKPTTGRQVARDLLDGQ